MIGHEDEEDEYCYEDKFQRFQENFFNQQLVFRKLIQTK